MYLRKLTQYSNEMFFRWYEWHHRKGFDSALRTEDVIVVEQDGIFGAGIMLYAVADSPFCIFMHITRNPFCDREFSDKAVDFLIRHLGPLAKAEGYEYFVSAVGDPLAKERYRKNNVKELIENNTIFYGRTS